MRTASVCTISATRPPRGRGGRGEAPEIPFQELRWPAARSRGPPQLPSPVELLKSSTSKCARGLPDATIVVFINPSSEEASTLKIRQSGTKALQGMATASIEVAQYLIQARSCIKHLKRSRQTGRSEQGIIQPHTLSIYPEARLFNLQLKLLYIFKYNIRVNLIIQRRDHGEAIPYRHLTRDP